MAPPSRLPRLDQLRALAVLLVLGRHLEGLVQVPWAPVDAVLGAWKRVGWLGVDLFFVLSGFLVTGVLFAEQRQRGSFSPARFYFRRALKILPPFWLLLGATVAARLLRGHQPPGRELLGELVFLQNYVGALWPHTWSLAVEEHFYLVCPWLLWAFSRSPSFPRVVLALAAGVLLLRVGHGLWRPQFTYPTHLAPTHLRLDGLLVGTWLAWAWHGRREAFERFVRRHALALRWAPLFAFGPFLFVEIDAAPWGWTVGFSLVALGSAAWVALAVGGGEGRPSRVGRWLAAVGERSYSIYLWHFPVLIWGSLLWTRVTGARPEGSAAAVLAYLGASVAVGWAMAHAVERPVLAVRDRLWAAIRPAGAAA